MFLPLTESFDCFRAKVLKRKDIIKELPDFFIRTAISLEDQDPFVMSGLSVEDRY